MKIVVTGADGQLGRSLRALDKERKQKFRANEYDYVFAGHCGLDVTDRDAVQAFMRRERPDAIVNCAAWTDVDGAESNEEGARLLNAAAPAYLAQAASETGALLIHISTDYVFSGDRSDGLPYTESDRPAPATAYGRTKLEGEEAIMQSGCRYLILRTAWLYSPYGKNFVKTMLRLFDEKEAIQVVADQFGSPTSAIDLARCIEQLLARQVLARQVLPCGLYHYTDEGRCSWYDFAQEISRLSGKTSCEIRPCTTADYPTPAHRPAWSVLDKTKIKEIAGLEIPDWKDALKDFIQNG